MLSYASQPSTQQPLEQPNVNFTSLAVIEDLIREAELKPNLDAKLINDLRMLSSALKELLASYNELRALACRASFKIIHVKAD